MYWRLAVNNVKIQNAISSTFCGLTLGWASGKASGLWWGTGVVICLERGAADLYMVQLMPLPPHHLLLHYNPECWLTHAVLENRPLNGNYYKYKMLHLAFSLQYSKHIMVPMSDTATEFGWLKPIDQIFLSIPFPFLPCLLSCLFVNACPFSYTFLQMWREMKFQVCFFINFIKLQGQVLNFH